MSKNVELDRLVSRQKLMAAARLREKEIEFPDIGVIRIRELTTDQRRQYLEYMELDDAGKPQWSRAKQVEFNNFIVGMGVITGDVIRNGEQGDLMFPDGNVPDIRFDVTDKLAHEILVLSDIIKEVTNTLPNESTNKKAISVTNSPLSLEEVLQKS